MNVSNLSILDNLSFFRLSCMLLNLSAIEDILSILWDAGKL